MHIPTADTDTLELLPFQEALEKSGRRGDYDAARWLYVPDFYTEYRYILGTRGEKPLICIGVNPSTAAPDALTLHYKDTVTLEAVITPEDASDKTVRWYSSDINIASPDPDTGEVRACGRGENVLT